MEKSMQNLGKKKLQSDLYLLVEEKIFHVGRSAGLCSASEYFEKLVQYSSCPNDGYPFCIRLTGVDADSFSSVLNFICTGSLNLANKNVFQLFAVADYFRIPEMLLQCTNYIISTLRSRNRLDHEFLTTTLELSEAYCNKMLKDLCFQVIFHNPFSFKDIISRFTEAEFLETFDEQKIFMLMPYTLYMGCYYLQQVKKLAHSCFPNNEKLTHLLDQKLEVFQDPDRDIALSRFGAPSTLLYGKVATGGLIDEYGSDYDYEWISGEIRTTHDGFPPHQWTVASVTVYLFSYYSIFGKIYLVSGFDVNYRNIWNGEIIQNKLVERYLESCAEQEASSLTRSSTFDLKNGETVRGMHFIVDKMINQATFITTTRTIGPFGNEQFGRQFIWQSEDVSSRDSGQALAFHGFQYQWARSQGRTYWFNILPVFAGASKSVVDASPSNDWSNFAVKI